MKCPNCGSVEVERTGIDESNPPEPPVELDELWIDEHCLDCGLQAHENS